jgi:hypothetical protein
MVENLTLYKCLLHSLRDRQSARFSGMKKRKCANLAGILMSEWRSALIGRKLVVYLGGSADFVPIRSCGDQNVGILASKTG